jgi:serine/threonine-protein kinase RCK2
LKNFIRHGKQARDRSPDDGHVTQSQPYSSAMQSSRSAPAAAQAAQAAQYAAYELNKNTQQNAKYTAEYNEAAQRIVAEEREAKNRLPRYPGLERFRLIDKMGE